MSKKDDVLDLIPDKDYVEKPKKSLSSRLKTLGLGIGKGVVSTARSERTKSLVGSLARGASRLGENAQRILIDDRPIVSTRSSAPSKKKSARHKGSRVDIYHHYGPKKKKSKKRSQRRSSIFDW